ncbi:hypothetical protein B7P43_G10871 [Cryptotermes secundus]|uniref:Uncharacterized protein n=1 Tax=Cryptotermes secundus TaxID=105785 RepID=A0A2J7QPH9_9NEOP|nr:hypothetical protein B7P43_G10871 [Cryptotermes secundus]
MTVNIILEITEKEAVVTYFKVVLRHFPRGPEEKDENISQDRWYPDRELISKPREAFPVEPAFSTVLVLAALGSVIAQYHVYENGEGQQNVGYDSPLSPTGSFTGATYGGGGEGFEVYPTVNYVRSQTTSYGEPVRNSYYWAGDHSGGIYDGGFGNEYGHHPQRVKIQVYRGPTLKSDYSHHATWGYYVVQPSDSQKENSYAY